jgi:crotonobetainyl-CoA:carnitine CoA-transferase CaiB-like acyl-CoA transferase
VNDIAGVFDDPQVRHLEMAVPIEHPALGEIRILRNATRIEGHPHAIRRPAPEAGEHSAEILRDFGFDESEIEGLARDGVI